MYLFIDEKFIIFKPMLLMRHDLVMPLSDNAATNCSKFGILAIMYFLQLDKTSSQSGHFSILIRAI